MSRKLRLAKYAERQLKRSSKKIKKAMYAYMKAGMVTYSTDYNNLSKADDLTLKAIGRVRDVIDS